MSHALHTIDNEDTWATYLAYQEMNPDADLTLLRGEDSWVEWGEIPFDEDEPYHLVVTGDAHDILALRRALIERGHYVDITDGEDWSKQSPIYLVPDERSWWSWMDHNGYGAKYAARYTVKGIV